MEAKTVAFANQKGGCGKTTTVAELACCLSERGYRVLVIDMDGQQGCLSWVFGADRDTVVTSYDVVTGANALDDAIQDGLDPLPFDLVASDARLDNLASGWNKVGKELTLRRALSASAARTRYDFILVDTPGSASTMTLAACAAADYVVVPTLAEKGSVGGVGETIGRVVDPLREMFGLPLEVAGIAVVDYDPRTRAQRGHLARLEADLGVMGLHLFASTVRISTAVQRGQGEGMPVRLYDPKCHASFDYGCLASELLDRLHMPQTFDEAGIAAFERRWE